LGIALLLLVLAGACGGGSSSSSATPTPSTAPSATASPTASASDSPTVASSADIPVSDLLDLARRYNGYNGPKLARTTPFNYQIGDSETFTLINLDTAEPYEISASVVAITDHAYFFVEDGSPYAFPSQVSSDFESIVWPTVTGAFGEPKTPGIDSDPRITVLNASLQGAGGYVSGIDGYPPAAIANSNGREMVYIEDSALGDPGPDYNGLISHELQHLVHANVDENEESWVNEGLSQVALEMGGGSSDSVWGFLGAPDTQLNTWPTGDTSVHYSESELFFDYVLDHYGGRQNAKALVDKQGNGIDGVQEYLDGFGKQFDDVFADFVCANLLDLASGPCSHDNFDGQTTAVDEATTTSGQGDVTQYGTDYLSVSGDPGQAFRFDGSDDVTIGIPNKDGAFWWSGRSDGIDSRLTREVDLTGQAAAALTFDTWYDTENGWDYAYVAASTDGGSTWKTLPGQHTTTKNPVGAAYGPGYTGNSSGWVPETVDLGAYAGKKILLRFELINDEATNLTGFAVDNIAIPAIGFTDSGDSANGWIAEGFSRIEGPLAQRFILQVIRDDGTVQRVELGADNTASIPLTADKVTIAISGATRNTTETAGYGWKIERTTA
jgi:immune inhibitor A